MTFPIKKHRHYLLANKFFFFTDHQALLYLVNKPYNIKKDSAPILNPPKVWLYGGSKIRKDTSIS